MKVCVVGIGYVGLVTAGCLAEAGNDVICVDKDIEKITSLKDGVIPIYEHGLIEIVKHNNKLGRLRFTTDLKEGLENSLIIFIAVGTCSMPDGSADISAVLSIASEIGENLNSYRIIVTKSTVPPGTYKKVEDIIKSKTEASFDYVSNPEFLKEGAAVDDFMRPDRIVIGTDNPAVREIMRRLYSPFMRKSDRIIFMDPATAEMTKYAANTMLAARISLMNEISVLCEKLGLDIEKIRRGVGSDSRIGSSFLFAGVGFGGGCLPKDILALIHTGREHEVEMAITKSVHEVNINQQERFAESIKNYFTGRENKTTLAVWGLAFKAKTNDIRQSPAIYCIKRFLNWGMKIKAYNPEANAAALDALDGKIDIFQNGYDALNNADALVIFTDWQEFRNPDLEVASEKLKEPVIFDGRNLYEPAVLKKAGFEYYSIGRAPYFTRKSQKIKGKIMRIVIQSLGIIFVLIGIVYMLKPDLMKSVMEFFKKGRRLYLAGVIRFVLAVIFLIGARECDITWVIVVFGIFFIIGGLLIFMLGLEKLKSIIQWWQKQSALIIRVIALIILAFGAIVIYCA